MTKIIVLDKDNKHFDFGEVVDADIDRREAWVENSKGNSEFISDWVNYEIFHELLQHM